MGLFSSSSESESLTQDLRKALTDFASDFQAAGKASTAAGAREEGIAIVRGKGKGDTLVNLRQDRTLGLTDDDSVRGSFNVDERLSVTDASRRDDSVRGSFNVDETLALTDSRDLSRRSSSQVKGSFNVDERTSVRLVDKSRDASPEAIQAVATALTGTAREQRRATERALAVAGRVADRSARAQAKTSRAAIREAGKSADQALDFGSDALTASLALGRRALGEAFGFADASADADRALVRDALGVAEASGERLAETTEASLGQVGQALRQNAQGLAGLEKVIQAGTIIAVAVVAAPVLARVLR